MTPRARVPLRFATRRRGRTRDGAAARPRFRAGALAACIALAVVASGCGGGGGERGGARDTSAHDATPRDAGARGTDARSPGAPANIVLVTIDTFRADHLHAAGYARETTPVIDSLAAAGALFTQAISHAPETAPSHASILTGAYPPAHAVRSNGTFALPDEMTTIAEMLRDAGYRTGAFVGAFVLDGRFGFAQGFDAYDDSMDVGAAAVGAAGAGADDAKGAAAAARDPSVWYGNVITGGFERRAAEVTDAALRWLDANASGPFFLWVHYYDPHAPYEPPPEHDIFPKNDPAATYARWEAENAKADANPNVPADPGDGSARRGGASGGAGDADGASAEEEAWARLNEDMVALYDGEIRSCDAQVGRIAGALRARGVAANTLVIVTSDHGESLDEDEYYFRHGWYLYDNVLRVPLVVSGAGIASAGAVVREQVELIDLFATMAAAAALDALPPASHLSKDLHTAIGAASAQGATGGTGAAPPRAADGDLAYAETFLRKQLINGPPLFAVRSPSWKYIEPIEEEGRTRRWLYDLASDPRERTNLMKEGAAYASRADSLRAALRAILAANANAALADANRVEPDEATVERLRALGYIK